MSLDLTMPTLCRKVFRSRANSSNGFGAGPNGFMEGFQGFLELTNTFRETRKPVLGT